LGHFVSPAAAAGERYRSAREDAELRRLHFDQYEFDTTGSEEELDVVIGSTDQFRDFAAFTHWAGITVGDGPPVAERPVRPLPELGRYKWVLDYIRRFAGLQLPDGGRVVVLSDEWDDAELVIVAGRYFVWYHWSTTA
jgi:hypothetical protein